MFYRLNDNDNSQNDGMSIRTDELSTTLHFKFLANQRAQNCLYTNHDVGSLMSYKVHRQIS